MAGNMSSHSYGLHFFNVCMYHTHSLVWISQGVRIIVFFLIVLMFGDFVAKSSNDRCNISFLDNCARTNRRMPENRRGSNHTYRSMLGVASTEVTDSVLYGVLIF